MHNMLEGMKEILRPEHCLLTFANLELKDKEANMTVVVSDVPDNALVVKLPSKGKAHLIMVAEKNNHKKSCDYLLFILQNDELDIYFIEMKKTCRIEFEDGLQHACDQIISTLPIVEYLKIMTEIHCYSTKKINKHFVVVFEKTQIKFDKQRVRQKPYEERKLKNRKFKVFYSSTIALEQLKCQTP